MQITFDIEKKKKIIMITSVVVTAIIILSIGFYVGNRNVRTFFDRYIFRKEITENNANGIDISDLESPSIYAYDQYITVLNKNQLSIYNVSRKKRIRIRNWNQ